MSEILIAIGLIVCILGVFFYAHFRLEAQAHALKSIVSELENRAIYGGANKQ